MPLKIFDSIWWVGLNVKTGIAFLVQTIVKTIDLLLSLW